jgi:hypothetical protein
MRPIGSRKKAMLWWKLRIRNDGRALLPPKCFEGTTGRVYRLGRSTVDASLNRILYLSNMTTNCNRLTYMTARMSLPAAVVLKIMPLALVLTSTIAIGGQTTSKDIVAATQTEVLQAHRAIGRAFLQNDVRTLDRLIAYDFVVRGPRGELLGDKPSILALIKAGRMTVTYNKDRNLRVRLEGNRPVVTGESLTRGTRDGRTVNLRTRFSDVFEKRNGQWQNVLSRITRVLPL